MHSRLLSGHEGLAHLLHGFPVQVTGEPHNTAAPVIVGPGVAHGGRMKDVLHPVHRHWIVRVGDVQDTLDPQQRFAVG